MNDPQPANRSVWVLMFDQPGLNDSPDDWHSDAFNGLELHSTFFEQYLLQDVRDSASLPDVLGGKDSTDRFVSGLRQHGTSTGLLRIACGNSVTPDDATGLSPDLIVERSLPDRPHEAVDAVTTRWQADQELRSALRSDLVWILARASSGISAFAGFVLELIQRLRTNTAPSENQTAILIVSAVRGSDRTVAAPFIAGMADSRVHAPLWIDNGVPHACRIQTVVGSFDLLPTVEALLTGIVDDSVFEQTQKTAWLSDPRSRCDEAMSLARLCNSPRDVPDRMLQLTGDGWTARRSQGFLLLNCGASLNQAEQPSLDQLAESRLYLKPDDVWNVNDVSGTYAEVAEEMRRA